MIEEPKIVTLKDLLELPLSIPDYQRPYRWTTESAVTLFNDIYDAFNKNIPEYRMGSVILHKNTEGKYDIVDGQQRMTTLTILVHCFSEQLTPKKEIECSLLEQKYDVRSCNAIVDNYEILSQHCKIAQNILEDFSNYALNKCTFVKIVTEKEQEAFQFFDSQNSRGKSLDPHDLLKAYHLREMSDSTENEKIKIINDWENLNQKELAEFFEYNLYPLVRWYKNKDGLNYSDKKIKIFKGIKKNSDYHYSIYHRAANLFVEHFNSERMYELTNGEKINQFQLTQPLIAGKRFFQYTLYYFQLYKNVQKIIDAEFKEGEIPKSGSGDLYVKKLFINALMFFIDRFSEKDLKGHNCNRLSRLYYWAYSIRMVMVAVYPETINKYALGNKQYINENLNIFAEIAEMQNPQDLDSIIFFKIHDVMNNNKKEKKYEDTLKAIKGQIDKNKEKEKYKGLWERLIQ